MWFTYFGDGTWGRSFPSLGKYGPQGFALEPSLVPALVCPSRLWAQVLPGLGLKEALSAQSWPSLLWKTWLCVAKEPLKLASWTRSRAAAYISLGRSERSGPSFPQSCEPGCWLACSLGHRKMSTYKHSSFTEDVCLDGCGVEGIVWICYQALSLKLPPVLRGEAALLAIWPGRPWCLHFLYKLPAAATADQWPLLSAAAHLS